MRKKVMLNQICLFMFLDLLIISGYGDCSIFVCIRGCGSRCSKIISDEDADITLYTSESIH